MPNISWNFDSSVASLKRTAVRVCESRPRFLFNSARDFTFYLVKNTSRLYDSAAVIGSEKRCYQKQIEAVVARLLPLVTKRPTSRKPNEGIDLQLDRHRRFLSVKLTFSS